MSLESLTDRRLRELEDQRDKAEAVAHILQGQLTERTRERDSARDLALVLEELTEGALILWREHTRGLIGRCVCVGCEMGRALTGSDSPEVA